MVVQRGAAQVLGDPYHVRIIDGREQPVIKRCIVDLGLGGGLAGILQGVECRDVKSWDCRRRQIVAGEDRCQCRDVLFFSSGYGDKGLKERYKVDEDAWDAGTAMTVQLSGREMRSGVFGGEGVTLLLAVKRRQHAAGILGVAGSREGEVVDHFLHQLSLDRIALDLDDDHILDGEWRGQVQV